MLNNQQGFGTVMIAYYCLGQQKSRHFYHQKKPLGESRQLLCSGLIGLVRQPTVHEVVRVDGLEANWLSQHPQSIGLGELLQENHGKTVRLQSKSSKIGGYCKFIRSVPHFQEPLACGTRLLIRL